MHSTSVKKEMSIQPVVYCLMKIQFFVTFSFSMTFYEQNDVVTLPHMLARKIMT